MTDDRKRAHSDDPPIERVQEARAVLAAQTRGRIKRVREARAKCRIILEELEPWQRDSVITSLMHYTKWEEVSEREEGDAPCLGD